MNIKKEKIILFLGDADSNAVTAKLKATKTQYKRKMLESGVENWKSILEYFDNYEVSAVTVKLIKDTYYYLSSNDHREVIHELLDKIISVPHLFISHENLITGEYSKEAENYVKSKIISEEDDYLYASDYLYHHFQPPEKEIREQVLQLLLDYEISLIPYKTNAELAIIVSSFLEENEHNLIFRFYIPSERIWANEAEKLLQLFRDYLHKVAGLSIRQDQYRTNQGLIYEFFGDEAEYADLPQKFQEFTEFMDVCSVNPNNAEIILESKNLSKQEVITIVERYSKEARRLQIDLKHERERKLLSIRHRLENDLSEHVTTKDDWQQIYQIVNSNIPEIVEISDAIKLGQDNFSLYSQNLTINIRPQIIESVNSVIAQEITGNQHLGVNGSELLELIDKYGAEKKMELVTAVQELADDGIKKDARLVAKQKLKAFALGVTNKAGDVAMKILQKYIEGQIGL